MNTRTVVITDNRTKAKIQFADDGKPTHVWIKTRKVLYPDEAEEVCITIKELRAILSATEAN